MLYTVTARDESGGGDLITEYGPVLWMTEVQADCFEQALGLAVRRTASLAEVHSLTVTKV
jgi:hypothetical protein